MEIGWWRANSMKSFKDFVSAARKALRKPLLVCGMVAGLSMGTAQSASAEAWDFSYSGGGISVAGTINAIWSVTDSLWHIISISGTHNSDAITGLWSETGGPNSAGCPGGICNRDQDNNFLAGSNFGAPAWPFGTQVDLHFTTAAGSYAFGYITGYNLPPATEGSSANLDHPDTGRCSIGSPGCVEITQTNFASVPEINASAALEALAIIFLFGALLREMFTRRRELRPSELA
jgi:hypothetical protein